MPSKRSIALYQLVSAGVFLFGVVMYDLVLELLCSGLPLFVYLLATGLGLLFGRVFYERLSSNHILAKVGRAVGLLLTLGALGGLVVLSTHTPRWDTKCSWRYCGRAMGVSLFRSPFPVGTPSCSGWHVCANEYPYSASEYDVMLEWMERQGCASP